MIRHRLPPALRRRVPSRERLRGTAVDRWATRWSPTFVRTRHAVDDDGIDGFCLFVGHPRSGITLVGQLLNAHPGAVISHELDALRYVQAGCSQAQLYELIRRRDAEFVGGGATWSGYAYGVAGQSQGGAVATTLIGDKHGAAATQRLARDARVLDRLRALVGVPVHLVHVVRDPRDTIPTLVRKGGRTVDEAVGYYRSLLPTLAALHDGPDPVHLMSLEDVVADPHGTLRSLMSFVGLDVDEGYLDACAALVFDEPNRSRDSVDWPVGTLDALEATMAEWPWLAGYLDAAR